MQEQVVNAGTGLAASRPDCASFIKPLRAFPCCPLRASTTIDIEHLGTAHSCGITRCDSTCRPSTSECRNECTGPYSGTASSSTTASAPTSNRCSGRHSSSRQACAAGRFKA